jgi:hypothetical protein
VIPHPYFRSDQGVPQDSPTKAWYVRLSDGANEAEVTAAGELKVFVTNGGGGGGTNDGLTDTQLRASPVSVSGSVTVANLPATQQVSGSVAVSNLPATQPVSGTVAVSNLPATQPVSGSVSVSNFPASQAVSGTFWQATQPVSGPLTDTQLRASAVPVSGTFFQATQPVSIASPVAVTGPLTDTQLRATAVPVSGPLTDTQLRATAVPVSGPLTDTQLRASPVLSRISDGTNAAAIKGSLISPVSTDAALVVTESPNSASFLVPSPSKIVDATNTNTAAVSAAGALKVEGTVTANAGTGTFATADTHTTAAAPLAVRLSDGSAFYTASGGSGGNLATAAKGVTPAGNPTSAAVDSNTQALHVQVTAGSAALTVSQATASSLNATVAQSGTWTVQPGNTANTTPWRAMISQGGNDATVKPASNSPGAADPALVVALSPNSAGVSQGTANTVANSWPIKLTDATNTAAVKAASTAAQTGDASLVVALSPNSPLASATAASNNPIGVVSLGNSLGKANVLKTGTLATSAVTADQVVLTYTVTTGKTFYLEYFDFIARLTTYAATATLFGTISLETPSGTKVYTTELFHAGAMSPVQITFSEPVAVPSAAVIRVVCTPAAVTAMTWRANFGGYEK